jgi:small-conductance mechanosensitive channel
MTTPDREPVPAALRAAVRRDFAPVTPLASPSRRALVLALPALVVLSAAVAVLARGRGVPGVFSLAGGGVSLLEWLAGFALLWLALREAVPGLGVGAGRALAALSGGILLQLLLGILVWQQANAALSGPGALAVGSRCASIEGAIGLPHLAIATWLALRALPIRPRWSGALAGAAAGLLADSLWHLACARNDLEHLLVWHFGATVAMTLVGAVAGSFWPRRAGANP